LIVRAIDFQNLKALILGMDGTLLDDNKEISDSSLEAIEKLKRKETRIAVFTGQDYIMALEYLNILDLEGPTPFRVELPSQKGKMRRLRNVGLMETFHLSSMNWYLLWAVMFLLGQILQVFLIGFMRPFYG
jgi:hypothetical protein